MTDLWPKRAWTIMTAGWRLGQGCTWNVLVGWAEAVEAEAEPPFGKLRVNALQ